jgi:bifunctional non-homologous end joining protein LigD
MARRARHLCPAHDQIVLPIALAPHRHVGKSVPSPAHTESIKPDFVNGLLERLWQRLQPLAVSKMPLAVPPSQGSRFGSPLVLSRVQWVRPEMVVEVSYAEWTPDGLLRHVVYLGEREDKPAIEVRRDPFNPSGL